VLTDSRMSAGVAVQGPDLVLAAAGELAARNVQVTVCTEHRSFVTK
jgi:hypothetical protein